jgi:sirohydrochlorin ferrochelatase
MRNPQVYRDHAEAAEDMAKRTTDHLLRTNFLQLARTWRTAASDAEQRRPPSVNAA